MDVAVQESAHVLVRGGNLVLVQYADNNSRVGHPGDFDVLQIVIDVEAFFERRSKRMHTRAARVDQRPIDIEKKETFLHFVMPKKMTKSE